MASRPPKTLCGVVVSAGKMMKAVKVRTAKQVYNSFLQKHYLTHQSYLVSDPTSSLRTGDVVRIAGGWRISRHIKHVVMEIVAPWGPGIDERPKILSEAERLEIKRRKREAKLERRARRAGVDGDGEHRDGESGQQAGEGTKIREELEERGVEGV